MNRTQKIETRELILSKEDELVRQMFNAIADKYDFLNHFLSLNIDKAWRREFVRGLKLNANDHVLDVCTGTGDLAFEALRQYRFHNKIVGIDFSPEMLGKAKKKSLMMGIDQKVQFMEGNALTLPFHERSFNAIMVAFGVRNFSDTEKGLRQLYRVLKLGGKLGILEFCPNQKSRLLKLFFGGYFQSILPKVGRFFSGDHFGAYEYLPKTVANFYAPSDLILLAQKVGFKKVGHKAKFLGLVHLFYFEK